MSSLATSDSAWTAIASQWDGIAPCGRSPPGEESIDDIEHRRPVGERGLSPRELLGTLIDGQPTEGDVQMIMDIRGQ